MATVDPKILEKVLGGVIPENPLRNIDEMYYEYPGFQFEEVFEDGTDWGIEPTLDTYDLLKNGEEGTYECEIFVRTPCFEIEINNCPHHLVISSDKFFEKIMSSDGLVFAIGEFLSEMYINGAEYLDSMIKFSDYLRNGLAQIIRDYADDDLYIW